MCVLVGDPQLERLRLELVLPFRLGRDLDLVAALEPVALRPQGTVDADEAAGEQPLRRRARPDFREAGEEAVEARSRGLVRDAQCERRRFFGRAAAPGPRTRGRRAGSSRRRR